MPKKASQMTAIQVKQLTAPGQYTVGTVAGLTLAVGKGEARSWVLRVMINSRRVEHGLGSYPEIGLAKAIERARAVRDGLRNGVAPTLTRGKRKTPSNMTFRLAAAELIKAKQGEWANAKHGQQWSNTLETYAYPTMGDLPVAKITRDHVMAVLQPIWATKTETATRVRQRIEAVLDWAKIAGHRAGDNPAAWAGNLEGLLAKPRKITKVENHAALDWREMPSFMAKLRAVDAMSARCLELTILTAVRSGEARSAVWSEFDLEGARWTIPAERMKADREHVVPLSQSALRLLKAMPRLAGNELVFPSPAAGGVLSDVAVSKIAKRLGGDVTVHGMRSAFRDWAAETTNTPNEVCEAALAHSIGSAVEAAYRRGDLLEKRKVLMQAWSDYCSKPPGTVTPIGDARKEASPA